MNLQNLQNKGSKKELKIDFLDFWPNFIKEDNFFYNLLSTEFNVLIESKNPDLIFFSNNFKKENEIEKFKKINIPKIYFTGENTKPDYNIADYSISFESNENDKNFYFPLWVMYINWFNKKYNKNRDQAFLTPEKNLFKFEKITKVPKKFCSFLAGNPNALKRIEFVNELSRYKKIGCGGKVLRNTFFPARGRGDQIGKINFISKYKFNICFENTSNVGYNTEKIFHPLAFNVIPIYWGDPNINKIFNPESFLNYHEFDNEKEFISKIIEVDNNNELYLNIINQPIFKNNIFPIEYHPSSLLKFLKNIIEKG